MKVPADFAKFLKNGENKKMLFDLIQQSIEDSRHTLNDRVVYFSNVSRCRRISQHEARPCPELACNHEEADTKLLALVKAAIHQAGKAVMVRSPSGDIDITALFIAHDFMGVRVFLDSGVGKSRKIVDLTSSTLSSIKRRAVVGLHAFSGNDYVSAFFQKREKIILESNVEAQRIREHLCKAWNRCPASSKRYRDPGEVHMLSIRFFNCQQGQ